MLLSRPEEIMSIIIPCSKYSFLKKRISAGGSLNSLPTLLYNAVTSLEYTSNKASSLSQDFQPPSRHISAFFGSPGTSNMLWFSGWSRPRSNQNHCTSLSMPGVKLGKCVLRPEPLRCSVVSCSRGHPYNANVCRTIRLSVSRSF